MKTIHMATKNKEHKEQLEAITMEQGALEEKLKCKEMELKHSKAREEEFQEQLTSWRRTSTNCLQGLTCFPTCFYMKRSLFARLGWGT